MGCKLKVYGTFPDAVFKGIYSFQYENHISQKERIYTRYLYKVPDR